jgi:hypothetical protein
MVLLLLSWSEQRGSHPVEEGVDLAIVEKYFIKYRAAMFPWEFKVRPLYIVTVLKHYKICYSSWLASKLISISSVGVKKAATTPYELERSDDTQYRPKNRCTAC